MASGGEGDGFPLLELLEELLSGAHLEVVVDREPGGGYGLHLPQLLHELLASHIRNVQGADGLFESPLFLGLFPFLLPVLLPLDLPHASFTGHGVSHAI